MNLKHHFKLINSADYKDGSNNKDGYYTICVEDLKDNPNIEIIGGPMQQAPKSIRFWIKTLRILRIPRCILRPFVEVEPDDGPEVCILLFRMVKATYLNWLRLKYPQATFVFFLRDLYKTKMPTIGYYRNEHLIDVWGSYDEEEVKKYHFDFYYPEIESKIDFPGISLEPTCDVFFAGAAKQRLSQLLEAYDYLSSHGIRCHFIIMDAKASEADQRDGIEYTHELIPYRQMLLYSIRCKCMLEINQDNAVGMTSRFLEAVMYNKKLITNSQSVKESPFYNPKNIVVFEKITDVDPSFILDEAPVDYGYDNEFSPIGLMEHIDQVISSSPTLRRPGGGW